MEAPHHIPRVMGVFPHHTLLVVGAPHRTLLEEEAPHRTHLEEGVLRLIPQVEGVPHHLLHLEAKRKPHIQLLVLHRWMLTVL